MTKRKLVSAFPNDECIKKTGVFRVNAFNERKVAEIFTEEKAKEYELKLDSLWHELVQAHASMYVIEKVLNFPADFLLDLGRQTFLHLVLGNFTRQVALAVINALTDDDPRSLTFTSLKKWIVQNCLPEIRDEVSVYLEGLAIEDEIKSLLERAKTLRNKLLAHLDSEYAIDPTRKAEAKISFVNLQCLVKRTEELLSGLCFGHRRSMLPVEYSYLVCHPEGVDRRSDIEYILDLLAADSTILRMPEEQEEYWPVYAEGLTQEQKKILNKWRRRIGKSEVW